MTDLEMTDLCRKAMGLNLAPRRPIPPPFPQYPESAIRVSPGKKADFWYDPLHEDRMAMALEDWLIERGTLVANKSGMDYCPDKETRSWEYVLTDKASRRRAIVECVTRMQTEKAKT